jgi:hypothetical protein
MGSMSKHSPGPWRYSKRFELGAFGIPRDAWNVECGEAGGDDEDRPCIAYGEPNARLIAAAPELLTALKKLLDCLREDEEVAVNAAEAIIARIEGGE